MTFIAKGEDLPEDDRKDIEAFNDMLLDSLCLLYGARQILLQKGGKSDIQRINIPIMIDIRWFKEVSEYLEEVHKAGVKSWDKKELQENLTEAITWYFSTLIEKGLKTFLFEKYPTPKDLHDFLIEDVKGKS